MASDDFSALLLPGETLVATLAGEAGGNRPGWWQVALTHRRFLAIRRQQAGATWQTTATIGARREEVRITAYPATGASPAWLEVRQGSDRIVYMDTEREPLAAGVRNLLAAWGANVPEEVDVDARIEQKGVMMVAGGIVGLMLLCCGCAGIAGAARMAFGYF